MWRASCKELNCRNIVFPVCCPEEELFKASSRALTGVIFCEELNFNNVKLADESKTLFVASCDELNSDDIDNGICFVNGELLT